MNVRELLSERGIAATEVSGGKELLFLCPFHSETKPSCEVHINDGVFYCFSCKASGSLTKLIAEIDGISYDDAKKLLHTGSAGDTFVSEYDSILEEKDDKALRCFSIKSFEKVFVPVFESPVGSEYLKRRGIRNSTVTEFNIRWGQTGAFSRRVVIPVYTDAGKLLTYTGRSVDKDVIPKTRKAQSGLGTLFGLYQLTRLMQESWEMFPNLVVVEGEFDAMFLSQNGFYAVSTMGTAALTESQMRLLFTYTRKVYLSYDNDEAGVKAQSRAYTKLRELGMRCENIVLPKGVDPDELGIEGLEKTYKGVERWR